MFSSPFPLLTVETESCCWPKSILTKIVHKQIWNLSDVFNFCRGKVAERFSILRACKDADFLFVFQQNWMFCCLVWWHQKSLLILNFSFFILSDPYYFAIHPVILIQKVFCTKLSVPRQLTFVVLASLWEISVLVVVHVLFVTKYQTLHNAKCSSLEAL